MLLKLIHSCNTKVLIELGRSHCGSFYCSYIWTQFNKSTLSRIRVAYNDLYRNILHVSRRIGASEMFVKNNIPNFELLLRKETFSCISRLKCSSNAIISTVESCCNIFCFSFINFIILIFFIDYIYYFYPIFF